MSHIKTSWDDDPLMYPAFMGCVSWALGNDEVMARFRADTGKTWTPGRTPIERMIDHATGVDLDFFQSFSDWVEANIFGTPDDLAGDAA